MKRTTPTILVAALLALAGCAGGTGGGVAPAAGSELKDVSVAAVLDGSADPMASCTDVFGDATDAAKNTMGTDVASAWNGEIAGTLWICDLRPLGASDSKTDIIEFTVTPESGQDASEVKTAGGSTLYFTVHGTMPAEQGKKVIAWQAAAASHIQK